MENMKDFMYLRAAKCEKITIFDHKQRLET